MAHAWAGNEGISPYLRGLMPAGKRAARASVTGGAKELYSIPGRISAGLCCPSSLAESTRCVPRRASHAVVVALMPAAPAETAEGMCPVPGCVKHFKHVGRHMIRITQEALREVAVEPQKEAEAEAGRAWSDGAGSGDATTSNSSRKRSASPLAICTECSEDDESERTEGTASPMAEEGASSEAPRKIVGHIGFKPCFFPGCTKQAKHVGRHKVRLPDGGIPERGAWRNVRARREPPPPREPQEPRRGRRKSLELAGHGPRDLEEPIENERRSSR